MKKTKTIPLIFLISMPIIIVVANLLTNFHIEVLGERLYISACLYPLLYLISGLIIRKSDYKDALRMMSITLVTASLAFVMQWIVCDTITAEVAIYSFLSFLICDLIFIYVYDFLLKVKKDDYFPVFLLFLLITLVDHIFFGAFIEKNLNSSTMLIRAIYLLLLPAMLCKPLFAIVRIKYDGEKKVTTSKPKVEEKEESTSKPKTATKKSVASKPKTTTKKTTSKGKTSTKSKKEEK